MKKHRKCFILPSAVLINCFIFVAESLWVPPDYWATIYRNGQLEWGRSVDELITFPPDLNSYIGYWIEDKLDKERKEAFGDVSIVNTDPPRFCGNFASFHGNKSNVNVCGGFRVLAYKKSRKWKNPFQFVVSTLAEPSRAVEYLDVQFARLRLNDDIWIYGSAKLSEKLAIGVNPNTGKLIRISFAEQPMVYSKNVKILESSDDFPKEDILSTSWPYPTFPPVYGRKNKNKIEIERIPKTTFLPTTLTSKTELTTMIPFIIEQSTTLMPYLPKKEEIKEMDYVEELSGAGINWNYSEDKELNKVNETLSSTTNKLRRELNNSIINRNYHQHRRKRFKVKRGHLL